MKILKNNHQFEEKVHVFANNSLNKKGKRKKGKRKGKGKKQKQERIKEGKSCNLLIPLCGGVVASLISMREVAGLIDN